MTTDTADDCDEYMESHDEALGRLVGEHLVSVKEQVAKAAWAASVELENRQT